MFAHSSFQFRKKLHVVFKKKKNFLSQPDTNGKKYEEKDESVSLRGEKWKAHLHFQERELLSMTFL